QIEERTNIVDIFFNNGEELSQCMEILSKVSDIERIVGKIGLRRVNGRDIKALQISLENIKSLREVFTKIPELLKILDGYDNLLTTLIESIDNCIVDSPPPSITEGGIIKGSYNSEVKELRELSGDSKSWIKEFEESEKRSTNINSLKIGFNKVFGYYIEVTNAQKDKVPERYIRKQTLVNGERYITEELKQKESVILTAQERLDELEYKLFVEFRESLIPYINQLQELGNSIAKLDILSGFAYLAQEKDYVKPSIYEMGNMKGLIKITGGRHPIVESINNEEFISNDTYLDFEQSSMAILTGPNMSGKSTYIRQVATIVLLAQIGCFVPAKSMELSLVDRIFTRVGASDDLSRGRSTFMVSIAWALAEFLVNDLKSRTLFATHYHELLKLSEKIPNRVKNYNVLVEEDLEEGTVIFLRKIVEGGTDRSYGIYVAKMAGLPEKLIKRANEILESFEQEQMFSKENKVRESGILESKEEENIKSTYQYPLFMAKDSEIERDIQNLDLDNLTPMEALTKISEWKKKV
ncbi:MAG: mismatch repair protein MutS, DNA mismatch repair protein MutS protein, partial [candidate division WS6 bacterium GW2011_GWC1_33_20]